MQWISTGDSWQGWVKAACLTQQPALNRSDAEPKTWTEQMLKKHPAAQQELCIIVSAERAAAGNATVLAFCVSLGALKGLFQQSQQSQHSGGEHGVFRKARWVGSAIAEPRAAQRLGSLPLLLAFQKPVTERPRYHTIKPTSSLKDCALPGWRGTAVCCGITLSSPNHTLCIHQPLSPSAPHGTASNRAASVPSKLIMV